MMDGGALTLTQDGVDRDFGALTSWNEMPDKAHEVFNASDTSARVITSSLVPDGAEPVTPQGESDQSAGTPLFEAQFPGQTMDGMFIELVRVIDFPAGTGTGLHVHGGPTYLLMIEGALTLRRKGTDTLYDTGESWVEMPGPDSEHEAFNASDTPAQVIAVYLLPMAPPLTFIQ